MNSCGSERQQAVCCTHKSIQTLSVLFILPEFGIEGGGGGRNIEKRVCEKGELRGNDMSEGVRGITSLSEDYQSRISEYSQHPISRRRYNFNFFTLWPISQ